MKVFSKSNQCYPHTDSHEASTGVQEQTSRHTFKTKWLSLLSRYHLTIIVLHSGMMSAKHIPICVGLILCSCCAGNGWCSEFINRTVMTIPKQFQNFTATLSTLQFLHSYTSYSSIFFKFDSDREGLIKMAHVELSSCLLFSAL